MNLEELRARGGFAPAAPVVREIKWSRFDDDGNLIDVETVPVYVTKHSSAGLARIQRKAAKEPDSLYAALLVSECIGFGDGSERLTYEQAIDLDPYLLLPLYEAAEAVNPALSAEKKSRPPTSSGTS